MAPSSRCFLMSLLVALAVLAPGLPPSEAARAGGSAVATAAAPSPNNGVVLHPSAGFDIHIPDLPIPPLLPCPPAFPKVPLIPCYNATSPAPPQPKVKECRSSLMNLMPCAGFLTNGSVPGPQEECCAAVRLFFVDSSKSPFCLCHVVNRDIGQLLPAPMIDTRGASLLEACGFWITPDNAYWTCDENKGMTPPMDAPSPPPSAPANKA